jgi:hypothetical protein
MLCLCVAVACPLSCDASSEPPAGGTDDGNRYVTDFAAMLCDLAAQCCAPHGFGTPTDCVASAKLQLQGQLDQNLDGGRRFDASAGEKCMAAYRGLAPACPNTFDFDICHDVFSSGPPVDAGCNGGCAKSDAGRVSCVTGSSTASDGAMSKGELCQLEVTVGPGQTCDGFSSMAVVRRCDRTKNSDCVQGICSTAKPVGAACTANTTECTPEAVCTGGVCTARVPVGGACASSECVKDAYCESGKCTVYTKWKKFCAGDFG